MAPGPRRNYYTIDRPCQSASPLFPPTRSRCCREYGDRGCSTGDHLAIDVLRYPDPRGVRAILMASGSSVLSSVINCSFTSLLGTAALRQLLTSAAAPDHCGHPVRSPVPSPSYDQPGFETPSPDRPAHCTYGYCGRAARQFISARPCGLSALREKPYRHRCPMSTLAVIDFRVWDAEVIAHGCGSTGSARRPRRPPGAARSAHRALPIGPLAAAAGPRAFFPAQGNGPAGSPGPLPRGPAGHRPSSPGRQLDVQPLGDFALTVGA